MDIMHKHGVRVCVCLFPSGSACFVCVYVCICMCVCLFCLCVCTCISVSRNDRLFSFLSVGTWRHVSRYTARINREKILENDSVLA